MPSTLADTDDPLALIEANPPDLPPDDFDSDDGDDGEPIRWQTVATYWNPAEAHIARIKLESEEIDCVMIDEHVLALWGNAVGGIKLQVPAEELIRARELLARNSQPPILSPEPVYDGQSHCPRCGSEDIGSHRVSRRYALLSMFLLGAPLPFLRRTRRCGECGFEWKAE